MNDWCPFAGVKPLTRNYTEGRKGFSVRAVVLHIQQGTFNGLHKWFETNNLGVSAHFGIALDGRLEQYVSINDTAHANGLGWDSRRLVWVNGLGKEVIPPPTWRDLIPEVNPNYYTISIEHEGFVEDRRLWTPPMNETNTRLLKWLAAELGVTYIPTRSLIGHFEINPMDRPFCPGPCVDFQRVAADANSVIENGSFEKGPEVGSMITLEPGSTAIAGWTVIRGSIDYVGLYWGASHGRRSIDLDGTPGFGGIAQTFFTHPSTTYRVHFDLAANPHGPPRTKVMVVEAAGQAAKFTSDLGESGVPYNKCQHDWDLNWRSYTWEFTTSPATTTTTLQFYSLDQEGGLCGPVLDRVAVVPISSNVRE